MDELTVVKVEAIASTRYALAVAADRLVQCFISQELPKLPFKGELISDVNRLCDSTTFMWPRLFFLRHIYSKYGMQCVVDLSKKLTWMVPTDVINKDPSLSLPDRFVVWGEGYKTVRETLTNGILNGSVTLDIVNDLQCDEQRKAQIMLLALFDNVTNSIKAGEDIRQKMAEAKPVLMELFVNSRYLGDKEKELARRMINNTLTKSAHLQILTTDSPADLLVKELIVHYWVVMSSLEPSELFKPLLLLLSEPKKMIGAYLPTMPQDDQYDDLNVAGIVLWYCPNGHPYHIGECGRPWVKDKCPVCGAPIGGQVHTPEEHNTRAADKTVPGHILGPADQQIDDGVYERRLTPASCSILRLMTHMSMFLGCENDQDGTRQLITQPKDVPDVAQYLWDHIQHDLKIISKVLGRSIDDTALLLHMRLMNIVSFSTQIEGIEGSLQSKQSRHNWEMHFSNLVIAPDLVDIGGQISKGDQALVEDTSRLAKNPLLKLILDTGSSIVPDNILKDIHQHPALWTVRSRVTLENLTQKVNEKFGMREQLDTLHLFLIREHFLRCLRHLPSIVRFQHILCEHYQGFIDSKEARKIKIKDFLKSLAKVSFREECQQLLNSLSLVWNIIRAELATFSFRGHQLQYDQCKDSIGMDTPISMLLPAWKGDGLCGTATIYYLATVQNDFLESWARIRGYSLTGDVGTLQLNPAHVINYDRYNDLMPLIVANSNYILEEGKTMTHEYNLINLQTQLEERFIRGKTRLSAQVSVFMFREDFTSVYVLKKLKEKLPQEPLPPGLHDQVVKDCQHLEDISRSLDNLDVAINFLVSAGGRSEMKLKEYMEEILNMKKALHSDLAMQECCLKHVESLWWLMAVEKAKHFTRQGQNAFEAIDENIQEKLPEGLDIDLHNALTHMYVPKFLAELYECILLRISIHEVNVEALLGAYLAEYIDSKDGEPIPALTEAFPDALKVKHSIAVWKETIENRLYI